MASILPRLAELSEAIEENRAKHRVLPTLALLYTAIDVLASLERRRDEGVQSAFVRWTEEFLIAGQMLPYSAMDLYAARCGILHAYTADSDLAKRGKAKLILYAWGRANADFLTRTIAVSGMPAIGVHLDDLVAAFHLAVTRFLDVMEEVPARRARIEKAADAWFAIIGLGAIQPAKEDTSRGDI
jgi:hypothetical protein